MNETIDERVQRWLKGEIGTAELYSLTPSVLQALGEHGYLLYEQGKYEDAKIVFEALCVIDAANPNFQKMLGSIYQVQKKWDAAYYRYTQSLKTLPNDIFVRTNRGEVLLELKRYKEAAEDFKQAILLDPDNRHPAGRRARVLMTNLKFAPQP